MKGTRGLSSFQVLEEEADHDVHVVAMEGCVDFDAAPKLKQAIARRMEHGARLVIVDLSMAGFIDSTGIGVIVGGLRRLQATGGSLAVVCPSEEMRGIFEIVGLESIIPLHESRRDAVTALADAA